MPTSKKPTSDSGRIILLDNILLTGNQDISQLIAPSFRGGT